MENSKELSNVLPSKFICRRCKYLTGVHENLQSLVTITCEAARAIIEPILKTVVPQYELCPHRGQALNSDELKRLAKYARKRKPSPEALRAFEKALIRRRGSAR